MRQVGSNGKRAAGKKAHGEKMVMAYGENGLELTPERETVKVSCVPRVADPQSYYRDPTQPLDGSPFTPASARILCSDLSLPVKVIGIAPHKTFRGVSVDLELAESRPLLFGGTTKKFSVCCVSESCARDLYFQTLPAADRQHILAAVRAELAAA